MNKNKKDSALYYQSLGLNIIPTGKDKKPLIFAWKEYQDKLITREQILHWWEVWPDANPALITGQISGVVVLDIDKKHNRSSKEFPITLTISAKSGNGGEHFFFRHPGVYVKSRSAISGDGVDIRGDGGYVLLDPSVNENGGSYEWLVPFESKNELAEMPEWLKKITINNSPEKKWLSGRYGVAKGSRNDTAASMSGKILSTTPPELWDSMGWKNLQIWNFENNPPLEEKELRVVFESIKKRHIDHIKIENSFAEKIRNSKAVVKTFTDIKSVPIKWLWPDVIPLGKLWMLSGDPGLGKSLISVDVAARTSTGKPWPLTLGGSREPADVVFISAEDDPADTIKPRLEALGADCSRIHILEAIQEEDQENGVSERMFSFERDLKALEELLSRLPNCRLVIIDPISAYLGSSDSNKNSDIRGLLAPLSKLAEKYKVAILLVSHLNKNTKENAIYRTTGSLAFVAAVRVAYMVTKNPDNPDGRLFVPIKSNISKDRGGLAYVVKEAENKSAVIEWDSNPVGMTADQIFDSIGEKEPTATDEAKDFLLQVLAEGPVKVGVVAKEAEQFGFTKKVMRMAREKLGVRTRKTGHFNDSHWELSLPEDAPSTDEAVSEESGILDNSGHLEQL